MHISSALVNAGQESAVSKVAHHRLHSSGSNPGGGKRFYLLQARLYGPWGPPSLFCNGTGALPRGQRSLAPV